MKSKLIFLTGYMASGKSTLGPKIAAKLGYEFVDTDKLIEKFCGMKIPDIFARQGEDAFRRYERSILLTLLNRRELVIATGGGLPCYYDNARQMKKNGIVIYLRPEISKIVYRIQKGKTLRPLLSHIKPEELYGHIEAQIARRETYYRTADITVEDDELDAAVIYARILDLKRTLKH